MRSDVDGVEGGGLAAVGARMGPRGGVEMLPLARLHNRVLGHGVAEHTRRQLYCDKCIPQCNKSVLSVTLGAA